MPLNQTTKNIRWMAIGTLVLLIIVLMVAHSQWNQAQQLAAKEERIRLVNQIGIDLATSAEAEKSAVMAITDEDSQKYADQAWAATAAAEKARLALESRLDSRERDLFQQFSHAFSELKRIDQEVLTLAVKNTNLKAFAMAFGPATAAAKEIDAALAKSTTPAATEVRVGVWRLLAALSPHIAEESDAKMDAMEAEMAKDDQQVRRALAELNDPTAKAGYETFSELRAQILKLSRENTNVRSLTLSLTQKRNATSQCLATLATLQKSIQNEPIAGMSRQEPMRPR
jgi:hypothetical protein